MAWQMADITGADCPECYSVILFKRSPSLGYRITCHLCNSRLAVIWTRPLRLGWILNGEADHDAQDDENLLILSNDEDVLAEDHLVS